MGRMLAHQRRSDEIKELFDEQISGIFQHIDTQLELLYRGEGCDNRLKRVVSGGPQVSALE
jgi:hypothetical protein